MPIELEELDGGLGYLVTASGSLMGKELVEWIRDHFARDEEAFRANKYSITDLSGVTETDVFSEEIRTLKSLGENAASRVNPDRVVAIISTTDVTFGLARMLEMLADQVPWDIAVFRSRPDAEQWARERMRERFGIETLTLRAD